MGATRARGAGARRSKRIAPPRTPPPHTHVHTQPVLYRRIYDLLAPATPFSPTYDDYILDAPYPATVPAARGVTRELAFSTMRDL